jgi:hypothetical protein
MRLHDMWVLAFGPGMGFRAFSARRTVGMQDSANGFRRMTLPRTLVIRDTLTAVSPFAYPCTCWASEA